MSEFAPMLVGIAFFTMIAFIVKTVADGRRRREHLKTITEFHNRLLDKLGSVGDFAQFLQTEGGTRFLDTLSSERGSSGPRDRSCATLAGIILLALGGARGVWLDVAMRPGAFILGDCLSLGVGFLLSSAASFGWRGPWELDQDAGTRATRVI
jgi:hypothetical protein